MSKVVGITRCSLVSQQDSPEVQASQIMAGAANLKLAVTEWAHEPPGTSGVSTKFIHRPQGRRLWYGLDKGDTLIAAKLDRLGRNTRDVVRTINHFIDRGVRVVILDLLGGQGMDLAGPIGQIIVTIMAACAELEAKAISERTKAHFAWSKAQGYATGSSEWGRKKVPTEILNVRGKQRHKLEWDMEFLDRMAEFVHRLRMGEKYRPLMVEFREKYKDWKGRPFFYSMSRKGVLYPANSYQCYYFATFWVKKFIHFLHNGELPSKYCIPGIPNPVDRGIAGPRWMDVEGFTIKRKPKEKIATKEDRSTWTTADWQRWWLEMNSDGNHAADDTESLLADIKIQARALGLVTPSSRVAPSSGSA